MSIACRKCGAKFDSGVWLERVNEKGVEGIWECRPVCGSTLSSDELLLAALSQPTGGGK